MPKHRSLRSGKMTRRTALGLLTLGSAGIVLATASPRGVAAQAPAVRGKVTISFWGHNHPPTIEMYKGAIEAFQKKYPNIQVDYSQKAGPQYAQLVLTAMASDAAPDIFRVGDWQVGEYIRDGALQPIDPGPWGARSGRELAERFVEGVQKKFLIGGSLYATPEDVSQLLNIINLDYLREATGSETLPATPEKLVEAARKMTVVKDGQWLRSGFEYYYQHELWQTEEWSHLIHSFGGAIYDKDGKLVMDQGNAAMRAAEYLYNSTHVWKFSNPAFALTFGQPTPSHFQEGKSAMNPAGAWKIAQIEQAGIVKNWQADLWRTGTQDFVLAWAWSLGVNRKSKNPEAASQFLAFLHSPEMIEYRQAKSGQIGGLHGADQTQWVKEHPKVQPWIRAQARAQFQDPYPNYPRVSKTIAKMFETIAILGTKPQEALGQAYDELRAIKA